MKRFHEPELNNNFEFYFKKDEKWYKAVLYAGDWDFKYNQLGSEKIGYVYSRYLKPNYEHEIIGRIYSVDNNDYYESYNYISNDHAEEVSNCVQTISFTTNEHGDIDLESVSFRDY